MRIVAALTAVLLPVGLLAQQSAPGATPENIRREIMALEERIGQANFACDYRFFAEVEATEFIFSDSRGGITTRTEDLAGEKDCRKTEGSYTLDDVRIMTYGEVVVFNAVATTRRPDPSGTEKVSRQRFTDVLVRRDGRWQLVSGHSSRIP